MVRSMYSGVAGMKAHQTRMDVIGNNIANVNTYGFKSSRATFRDMYYQSIRDASGATANRGGMNPSSVGYGSQLSSIDLLMTQSSFTSTGNPLDLAIAGEGFFQVMDADGNIFYTKAGMLDVDSAGNLIDSNGNFVLGTSGDPLGKTPGSNKITFSIPSVNPSSSTMSETINGNTITISSSNSTNEGNVSFMFQSSTDLPIGQRAKAIIDSGSITIQLNANETFTNTSDLSLAINQAITEANGGVQHPAGTFNVTMSNAWPTGGLNGAEIVGKNYGYNKGSLTIDSVANGVFDLFSVVEVSDKFSGTGSVTYDLTRTTIGNPSANPATEDVFEIEVNIGSKKYTATLTQSQMENPGNVILKESGTNNEDTITMSFPSYDTIIALGSGSPLAWTGTTGDAVASTPSNDLGLGEKALKLDGGTTGGTQTIKDLTGIAIGADGSVIATHAVHGRMTIGRIDLVVFDNPKGLIQSGNTYFAASSNSGNPKAVVAGQDGSGELVSSALELSNVDLSQEFSDIIVTQRGFQANSRLITVSDTMLEELINLKR